MGELLLLLFLLFFFFFKQVDTALLSGSIAYVQTGIGRTGHKVKMGGGSWRSASPVYIPEKYFLENIFPERKSWNGCWADTYFLLNCISTE